MLTTPFRLALGTVTIIPSGELPAIDRRTAGAAMLLAPVAVTPVAAVSVALGWVAAAWGLPTPAAGAIVVGGIAYGTRAMHLDGLADTVDGFGGGWTRERALDIMRRGDIGPMGVSALVVTLLVQACVLGALVASAWGALLAAVAVVTSRGALALCSARPIPAAREDGLGAVVASSVRLPALVVQCVMLSAALAMVALGWQGTGGRWWVGLVAAGLSFVTSLALLRRARTKLGGVTGDIMGASVELSLTALLIGLAGGLA